MKIRPVVLAATLALASGAALGAHCPKDMKAIDEAIAAKPSLSASQMDEVMKLRAEGEALHKAGKHKESVETLDKAMKILGLEHKS
ncbi:MAG: hypothetical protein ACK5YW_16330 [Betaproteobacteria bacterium]|jgi:hypothetical protein|nr:hypothetical protein [Rhodocyclaceae bacterium]MCA3133774.1 hypothetical protein [Rhodocyclaceae bacterium]MCA3142780.1 hypothetical protein [Rhodocyclaceae bacterium]MCA3145602.1 hypothetical protein [Rhodocyclaceae bacterium]